MILVRKMYLLVFAEMAVCSLRCLGESKNSEKQRKEVGVRGISVAWEPGAVAALC